MASADGGEGLSFAKQAPREVTGKVAKEFQRRLLGPNLKYVWTSNMCICMVHDVHDVLDH